MQESLLNVTFSDYCYVKWENKTDRDNAPGLSSPFRRLGNNCGFEQRDGSRKYRRCFPYPTIRWTRSENWRYSEALVRGDAPVRTDQLQRARPHRDGCERVGRLLGIAQS